MINYAEKSYGRNREVDEIYRLFAAGRDVAMPGPRRLGKTFLLDRLVDAAEGRGFNAIKIEVAGCNDTRAVFRELCSKLGGKRSGGERVLDWVKQRLGQVFSPRSDQEGPWYLPFLNLDHETHFERLLKAMHDDQDGQWVLLIDELPIFLKALHDKGPHGLVDARNFMNWTSRVRTGYPRVRWMITGSIGIEPLAREGEYMGVLAKYQAYELHPLTIDEAIEFVKDLAADGQLPHRRVISNSEARAIAAAVGWLAPYYLDALAQKLSGSPTDDPLRAAELIEDAAARLLEPSQAATFGTWEEHLRKHYRDPDRGIAFSALAVLAENPQGVRVDTLLATIGRADLTREALRSLLVRLHTEGFLTVANWNGDLPTAAFRNPLLRRWWRCYPPQPSA